MNHQEEDFELALKIFSKYNIVDRCLEIAESYMEKAKEALKAIPDSQIKLVLMGVLDFSLQRSC